MNPSPNVAMPRTIPAMGADVAAFVTLLKPRVMFLVVFTGLAGLHLAPGTLHPVLAVTAMLCIAIGAGASGAINMWYDRDIDAIMTRTSARPIPRGEVEPGDALGFGVVLAVGSITFMGLAVNWVAAGLLAATIGFYVFVYTMWLKRRTPQNIVIGGAAGAFPPMIGWAAVTGSVDMPALIMFAIIFIWTPPHFWSLALYRSEDYARAGVPMLPVVAGARETKKQIVIYSLVLAPLGVLPAFVGMVGWPCGVVSALLGALFVLCAVRVWQDDGQRSARQMFAFSILYLFLLFTFFIVDGSSGIGL